MIPEERQPAVARALSEAFGVNEFEEIRPLGGGLSSALVFRIVVRGTPYLLRLIHPWGGVIDPTHQIATKPFPADLVPLSHRHSAGFIPCLALQKR